MKEVDAFVGANGQPQHLAVQDEKRSYGTVESTPTYRPVCGGDTNGQTVGKVSGGDAKFACGDCAEQFKMWKEVNS